MRCFKEFFKKLKSVFKHKQKDLTYEEFIDLEGKKFRMPTGSAESYGQIEIYRRYHL